MRKDVQFINRIKITTKKKEIKSERSHIPSVLKNIRCQCSVYTKINYFPREKIKLKYHNFFYSISRK